MNKKYVNQSHKYSFHSIDLSETKNVFKRIKYKLLSD